MDDLLGNDFKARAVKKINLCRLFLQEVESLAEICNPTATVSSKVFGKANAPPPRVDFFGPGKSGRTRPPGRYGVDSSNSSTFIPTSKQPTNEATIYD
jgi:hypothetical protein